MQIEYGVCDSLPQNVESWVKHATWIEIHNTSGFKEETQKQTKKITNTSAWYRGKGQERGKTRGDRAMSEEQGVYLR